MDNKMKECNECKGWEDMIPHILGFIFQKLSLKETLTVIPRVCKSWKREVYGCQEIDILKWSRDWQWHVERMLHMLVTRSSGSLRKLRVSHIPNDSVFSFIADHAGSLRTLEIPTCNISDSVVVQVAEKLSSVTSLDISHCTGLGPDSIEAFGRHCKSLVKFKRVTCSGRPPGPVQLVEARAIAQFMPKLQYIELLYLALTTEAALDIISSCKDLKCLDIRCCWGVELDLKDLKEKRPFLEIAGPDLYWDYYSESSDEEFLDEFIYDDVPWDDTVYDDGYDD